MGDHFGVSPQRAPPQDGLPPVPETARAATRISFTSMMVAIREPGVWSKKGRGHRG